MSSSAARVCLSRCDIGVAFRSVMVARTRTQSLPSVEVRSQYFRLVPLVRSSWHEQQSPGALPPLEERAALWNAPPRDAECYDLCRHGMRLSSPMSETLDEWS